MEPVVQEEDIRALARAYLDSIERARRAEKRRDAASVELSQAQEDAKQQSEKLKARVCDIDRVLISFGSAIVEVSRTDVAVIEALDGGAAVATVGPDTRASLRAVIEGDQPVRPREPIRPLSEDDLPPRVRTYLPEHRRKK